MLAEVFTPPKSIFDADVLLFEIKLVFFTPLKYTKENNISKHNFSTKYKYFDAINAKGKYCNIQNKHVIDLSQTQ